MMEAVLVNPPPAAADTPIAVEDRVLVKQAQRGDFEAYDELVRRHQERIYATLYNMTSNH